MSIIIRLQTGAQTRFAYLPEGKTAFQSSLEKIIVGIRKGQQLNSLSMSMLNASVSDTGFARKLPTNKWNVFTLQEQLRNPDSIGNLLSLLRSDSSVAYANPFLVYKDGTLQGLTDQVIVRIKASSSSQSLDSVYAALGVYIVKPNPYLDREFFLSIHPTSTMDALDVADSLYGTGLFEYSEPDFVKLAAFRQLGVPTPNDPLFPDQWYLQNTGQYNGTVGADIKAPAAWCTATGTGIKIAIIDEGVDLAQPDLVANLLPGYDALDQGTNGAPTGDDAHGTACAGIAAAVANNGIGVAGVANTANIIPVRTGSGGVISTAAATTGIGWAVSPAGGNADILSCSWGGGSSSSSLNNAIASAISSGRGGKGCTVLFASGDVNQASIEYPSSQPNVISVGGTNMCDQRFNVTPQTQPGTCNYDTRLAVYPVDGGSSYGTGLGVVAPGINMATTDISGQPGYSDLPAQGWEMSGLNYVLNFDGTSASCPQAAAVVALMLSINPSLTYSQTTQILEETCDEVGGYSYSEYLTYGYWNDEMGYGRIDAASAVEKALGTLAISGPSYICSGSATYSVSPPAAVTTTWALTSGIATLSCTTCNTTSVRAVSQGTVGLTATFSNACGTLSDVELGENIQIKQNPLYETNTEGVTCNGSTRTWTLALSPGSEGTNYNWYVSYLGNNSEIYIYNGSTSEATVDVVGGGTVSVTYTDICGSPETNGATVYAQCEEGEVVLAPNPASNTVTVVPAVVPAQTGAASSQTLVNDASTPNLVKIGSVNLNKSQPGSGLLSISMIKIYDVSGKLRKQINYPAPGSTVTIDVSDLAAGIYFVQIYEGKNFETTKKLVIMR
jgi:subtilisin family serine protease